MRSHRFAKKLAAFMAVMSILSSLIPMTVSHARQSLDQIQVPVAVAYEPGVLIVKMRQESPSFELLERHGLIIQESLGRETGLQVQSQSENPLDHLFVLRADESTDMQALAEKVATEPGVQYAEPNYRYTFNTVPNDPFFAPPFTLNGRFYGHFSDGQWYLERCQFVEASTIKPVVRNTVVVNLDTGGSPQHKDLAGNTWTNRGEVAGNRIDDDGNGHIDDVFGWNFVDDNNDIVDVSGHGTLTSGLAAVSNNREGIAGTSDLEVMNLTVGKGQEIFLVPVLKALPYAKAALQRQGKQGVFNASWSGPGFSQSLFEAIRDSKMLFIASSGNHGREFPNTIHYPAGLNELLPNVMSITGSTYDEDDRIADVFSFIGSDLAAPGTWILTAEKGGSYRHVAGTSFSAPLVAHAAAMVMDEIGPDPLAVRTRLVKSVDLRPALAGKTRSGGRLNVARALRGDLNPNRPPQLTLSTSVFSGKEGILLPMTATATDPDGDFVSTVWQFSDGQTFAGSSISPTFRIGNYSGTVTITDGALEAVASVAIEITDNVELRLVKAKKYRKAPALTKKITIIAWSSQRERANLRIEGLGPMTFDAFDGQWKFEGKKLVVPSEIVVVSGFGAQVKRLTKP